LAAFHRLLEPRQLLVDVPLLAREPTDLPSLEALGQLLSDKLDVRAESVPAVGGGR
jgi:hypothetical protein